ncbi:terminase small subunit [Okeania sp. SIO2B9]|uniref:terminase small subunit n=1 Tax=Okeania sp. SIO2B9 TaxID=2607782 RepID=UPI0014296F10|nr:terminase small subunit [Okeania sp. SIO2B9]NES91965.1 terminase small subunit [Okeania sp. SIO2B9]
MPETPVTEENPFGLNARQKKFCELYVETMDRNQSYTDAGYTDHKQSVYTNAAKLLQNPKVKKYVNYLGQQLYHDTALIRAKVIEELTFIMLSDITDVCEFDSEKITFSSSRNLPRRVRAAIQNISATEITRNDKDGNPVTTVRHHVKMHDKIKAADLLATYTGAKMNINIAIATLEKYGVKLRQNARGEWFIEEVIVDLTPEELNNEYVNEEE